MNNTNTFKIDDRVRIKYPDRYFKEFRRKWNDRTGIVSMQCSEDYRNNHCRINIDAAGRKKAVKNYFIGFEDLEKIP